MATDIPLGYGVARHIFNLTGRPNNFVVTMGYRIDAAQGPFSAPVMAERIAAAWGAEDGAFAEEGMISAYTYLGVEVSQNEGNATEGDEVFTGSAPRNITGTNGGAPLPPNVAFIVTKRSTSGGRRGRGRWYLPPLMLGEGQVDGSGSITDNVNLGIYQQKYTASLGFQLLSGPQPVILHADGSEPSDITGMTLQRTVATQRRRLR